MPNLESFTSTEERIRSGEIEGRSALEYLQKTGLYAFHGTSYQGEILAPHQAMNNRQPDGTPAVAAAMGIETPIFRSLINPSRYLKANEGTQSAWVTVDNLTCFLTLQDIYDSLQEEDRGYVYALALQNNHQLVRSEIRFPQDIKPDFTIETHKQDLPLVMSEQDFRDQQGQLTQSSVLITFGSPQDLEHFHNSAIPRH